MDQPDAALATLLVSGGLLDGTEYPLVDRGRPILLGSSMDADVQIMLGNVEAAHACITRTANGLTISDVGSATGTFVNGEPIEEVLLKDGDEISLGNPGAKGTAKLILQLKQAKAGPPPAAKQAAPPAARPVAAPATAHAVPALQDSEPPPALDDERGLALVLDETPGGGLTPVEPDETTAAPTFRPAALPLPKPAAAPPQPVILPAQPVVAPPATAKPVPPPPPKPAAPPPPPPSPASAPSLAPKPAAAPLPVSPPPQRKPAPPAYHADLPSIPPATPAEALHEPLLHERESFPPLTPKPAAGERAGPVRRRRGLSLPSLPLVPVLGALGAVALVALGVLAWRALSRPGVPELVAVAPTRTQPGQVLTLSGRNFARDPSANTVLFGAARGVVTAATASELKVKVPAGASATVPVTVETRGGRSRPVPVTVDVPVQATAIDPEVAIPGQRILVRAEGLAGQTVSVEVGGAVASSVETTPEGVRAVVPEVDLPEGTRTSVVLRAGSTPPRSFDLFIGRMPLLLGVVPPAVPLGGVVTLQGRGFDPDPQMDTVTFGGEPGFVLAASRNELKVVVPAVPGGDAVPELPVVVKAAGRTSTSRVPFRLVRTGGAGFHPRFFPTPVSEYPGEPLAFVSSELGPLLLLGGRGNSPSVGERALAVAAALNRIVDKAGSAPAFEFRPTPQPCVGVAGDPQPLLSPTAQDLAAYGKPWAGGKGPARHVGATALARHWTALLQDYLGLFLFRQRPVQMLSLSQRGRVLGEIYSEANRRAPGEVAIPSGVVQPLPQGWATGMKQLALVVAEEGVRSANVVEGSWQGEIQDPDLGPQAFRAQLRTEGGGLAGTLTTSAGSLEVQAPLREIAYERGTLRFTADLQGAHYKFSGTLQGDKLSGTIERPKRPPLPFTMRYLE